MSLEVEIDSKESLALRDLVATDMWELGMIPYLNKILQKMREKNDSAMTEIETASLRGDIKRIKKFMDLGKSIPVV